MPDIVRPAPDITPVCPYFYQCGGCDSQDISYPKQLAAKEQRLRSLFGASVPEAAWQPIVGSPEEYPLYFRNKIRFAFVREGDVVRPSRHQKGSEEGDIPVDRCFLLSPVGDLIMNLTARAATDFGWTLYNPATRSGWLKHLLIREGKATGEILVSLVTDEGKMDGLTAWADSLRESVPAVVSIFHSRSWGATNTRFEDDLLWGELGITDKIGNFTCFVSPHAFFQPNGSMVTALYQTIEKHAGLQGSEHVWDLYAGSATIGMFLSGNASKVTCIESNEANCADANWNLQKNNVTNVTVHTGAVEDVVTSAFCQSTGLPDVVILDPPRAGLHERFRRLLPNLGPKKVVYTSCNPTTCYRDIQDLGRAGYRVTQATGVDMFPHTWHCELVLTLER
ncbi:MAG TPA: 23S rRNA (uracil(1939)-C(5))-methyltransferase RlmD [Verrucomicrobiae bacterium]|nr:23S rRNA (uracil(1939)-C(5))-methyltransferase RlmD [Verrucomicrobiae bacterium]